MAKTQAAERPRTVANGRKERSQETKPPELRSQPTPNKGHSRIGAYKRAQRPRRAHTQKKPTEPTKRLKTAKEEVSEAGRRGTGFYIFLYAAQKGKGKRSKGKEIIISPKANEETEQAKKGRRCSISGFRRPPLSSLPRARAAPSRVR